MSTFKYLRLLISHNYAILMLRMDFQALKLTSFIGGNIFVLRGKGSKGDYHLQKLAKGIANISERSYLSDMIFVDRFTTAT